MKFNCLDNLFFSQKSSISCSIDIKSAFGFSFFMLIAINYELIRNVELLQFLDIYLRSVRNLDSLPRLTKTKILFPCSYALISCSKSLILDTFFWPIRVIRSPTLKPALSAISLGLNSVIMTPANSD